MPDADALTQGQREALADLRRVADQRGGLRIDEWRHADGRLTVTVALDCRALRDRHVEGGLELRDREFFEIHVPASYPLQPPSLSVRHARFAGYENVMRGGGICVFRSPDTEWAPSDGAAVFVRDRIWGWLDRAVRGEVERQNGAFHAPVLDGLGRYADVVRYDAPEPDTDGPWMGFVGLRLREPAGYEQSERPLNRWSLTRWADHTRKNYRGEMWGAGLLLPARGHFYFPNTLGALLDVAESCGLGRRQVVEHLGAVAYGQSEQLPLVVVVGTPMGSAFPGRHHLTTLVMTGEPSRLLRRAGGTVRRDEAVGAVLARSVEMELEAFFGRDARRGHVQRRDEGSPMDWFAGKTVAVWGAGALGAPVAEQVARAGAARVILRDSGYVHDGLLVRQPYTANDCEVLKVDALRHRLRTVRPNLTVTVHSADLRGDLSTLEEWGGDVDLVVNATASAPVRVALDLARAARGGRAVPVLTVGVDARAERGFARLLTPGATASNEEVERDAQIAVCGRADTRGYADAFFPSASSDRRAPFYPEPGCSDATFVGSAADMAALSGSMMNWAAAELAGERGPSAQALLVAQPHAALRSGEASVYVVPAPSRLSLYDERQGYEVRMAEGAVGALRHHVAGAAARNGRASETGGPLWGRYDDALRVVWVDDAGPAPPDSVEAPDRFVCGVDGLRAEAAARTAATRGAAGFVGTWHTHPACEPVPSPRDEASMADVCTRAEPLPRRFLMLIVSSPHADDPEIRPFVFTRDEFSTAPPSP
jgi:hypothetical protein